MTPFTNPSRNDGLVLRHWKMTSNSVPDEIKKKGPLERPEPAVEEDYPFKRYNVKVKVPEYTDAEYEQELKSDTWSKEETDYLMELCREFDLRWILITDRYEYQPASIPPIDGNESTTLIPAPQPRTMEDLKSRYYTVAAKCLAIARPPANMTTAEFELYEKMRKFDPVRETSRKKIADSLMRRTVEEVEEESFLLGELKRIVEREEIMLSERRELYARLDAPQSSGNVSQYHNSAGISQLMQTLLNADKNKRKRSMGPGEVGVGGMSSPATAHPNSHLPARGDHDAGPSTKQKQPSISHPTAPKPLSSTDQIKYGVSYPPDRITSGVQFRSDRATKLTQAKSQVQTNKLQAALTELGLPPRLTMPTEKVVSLFERLVTQLQTLLDVRKVSERLDGEIKVLEAMVKDKERKARGESKDETEAKGKEAANKDGDDVVMANGDARDESVDQGNKEGDTSRDANMDDADAGNVEGDTTNNNAEADAEEDGSRLQAERETQDADEAGNEEADESDDEEDVEADEDAAVSENSPEAAAEDEQESADGEAEVDEDADDAEIEEDEDSQQIAADQSDDDQESEDNQEDDDAEAEAEIDEDAEQSDDGDAEVEAEGQDSDANDEEQDEGDGDEDGEDQDEEEDDDNDEQEPALDPEKGPVAAATRQHKRSASVMSGGSKGSGRGSVKRGRKS
jgi:DNA methyltransferase 1-associated protein 1